MMKRRLGERWVILREIRVRVRVGHRFLRVALGKRHAISLTVYVVLRPSVLGKVGALMDNGSCLYLVNE